MIDTSVMKPPYHSIDARQNRIACGAVSLVSTEEPEVVSAETASNQASIQLSPASVLKEMAANTGSTTQTATSAR